MTVPAFTLLGFPGDNQLANAYFQEAARHLEDACLLHTEKRYAGAITSAMKTIELGLKSVLILEGVRSWIDLNQHEVFTKIIEKESLFRKLQDAITTQDRLLAGNIKTVEALVPQKQQLGKLDFDVAANTEYPFFARNPTPPPDFALFLPGAHFTETTSKTHLKTAHRLLGILQKIHPSISAWNVILCDSPS